MRLFSTVLLSMLLTWGASRGLNAGLSFDLPLADAGSGAVNTAVNSSGGSGAPTFTRATAAASKLSTGLWKLDVPSGTARSSYLGMNTAIGAYGGYLSEGARTNLCLQSRDLSNASWAKVNTTGAKDQTGIDGVANSASSLTATLGGGTCLQTITEAATDSTFSVFIKRITGTGTITIQQGATTSEISSQLNSVTYTQVSLEATVLNPAIGISLGTNGDKIAVDCVQFENGAFASTPIQTTTVAVTRNADVLNYASAGNVGALSGSFYYEQTSNFDSGFSNTPVPLHISDGSANNRIATYNGNHFLVSVGGVTQCDITSSTTAMPNKATASWSTNAFSVCLNAAAVGTDASGTIPTGLTTIQVGGIGTVQSLFGVIKNVRIWTRQLPDAVLRSLTT